jgi:hypothetical protein
MIKRRLGNHVRARTRWGQVRELALVVLTHNLMILWCSILFYRAFLTPFLRPFSSSPTNSNQLKLAHDRTEIRNPPDSPLAKRELLRLENQPLNQR